MCFEEEHARFGGGAGIRPCWKARNRVPVLSYGVPIVHVEEKPLALSGGGDDGGTAHRYGAQRLGDRDLGGRGRLGRFPERSGAPNEWADRKSVV